MKNKLKFLIIICIAFISVNGLYAKNMKPVDLSGYYNGDGFSFSNNQKDGNFDGLGYSYPAEEFPKSTNSFGIEKVAFVLPSVADGKNNFYVPDGKRIEINAKADRLFILASSIGGNSFIEAEIKTTKRKYKIRFNITDWAESPAFGEKLFAMFSCRHKLEGGDSLKVKMFFYTVFLKPLIKDEKIEWIKFIKQSNSRIFALTTAFTEKKIMLSKGKNKPKDPNYFSFYPNSKEENYFLYSKGGSDIIGTDTRCIYKNSEGVIYKLAFHNSGQLIIKIQGEGGLIMSSSNDGSNYTDRVLNFADDYAQTEVTVDNSCKLFLKFSTEDENDVSIHKISFLKIPTENSKFQMAGR